MKTQEFQAFTKLIEFDDSVVRLQQKVQALSHDISQKEDVFEEYDKARVACHEKEKNAQKLVHHCEQEIAHIEAQEKTCKQKLEAVKTQKQQTAAQREYERLGQRRHELEQELVAAWNRLDTVKQECSVMRDDVRDKEENHHHELTTLKKELVDLKQELVELEKQRAAKLNGVPEAWLEIYDMMKGRVTNPVVPIVNNGCSACFYPVTNNDLQSLTQHKLLQCQSCYRLLYLRD